jgi:hypothetical protein
MSLASLPQLQLHLDNLSPALREAKASWLRVQVVQRSCDKSYDFSAQCDKGLHGGSPATIPLW